MTSDHLQREQALDPDQSFIVQAPAGSGKTELLTQRFLRLLATVQEPEEILAITFTKKAASEMRSRINTALMKAQHEPLPKSPHQQHTWQLAKQALVQDQQRHWGLLTNPNRLRIKTIDAFNSLLTRQLPLLSHFGAPPEIIDHPQVLYREAVQSFLLHLEEKLEWSQAIAQLLLHLDNNMKQAEELLIEMLSKRDQWLPYIIAHHSHPALREQLEANLAAVISDHLSALKAAFPEELVPELISLLQFALSNLKISKPDSPLLRGEHLQELPGTQLEDLEAWLALARWLTTDDDQWRKRVDVNLGFPPAPKNQKQSFNEGCKKRMQVLLETLSVDEKLETLLSELRYLPNARYTEPQWDILKALHEVLKILVAQLSVTFKLHGKIDYTENAQAALLALGSEESPTDLALVLDYQIKHLLVDEFQDTSHNQFRLLEKLVQEWQPGDGRSLFLVGDPMQSIYRFREAEVGLFIRARDYGLGPISLTPLTLSVNFRSTAAIVQWINMHFDKVMPAFDDLGSGAVSYTPSTPQDEKQADENAVQCHALVDALPQTQAEKILHLVQEALANYPEDKIAILVRSRSHLRMLIPAFKKAQLAYQAVEIDPLETRPLIQDLLALTRALLYPADRVAWLAILRAPWCGLTLNDLLLLTDKEPQALIWQCLQQPVTLATLSPEGQQRLRRILPVLEAAVSERRREELHLWVENTWTLLGGPACLESEAELKDATIFFKLLQKLSLSGSSFKSGLKWEILEETIEKLYAQHKNTSRLQIMTIHNAKGLEFDTVILPHLEKGIAARDKPLLTWLERPLIDSDAALLLAPLHAVGEETDQTYAHIRSQDNHKTQHENGRLLYVAATRAKKSLHLLMSVKTNSKGDISSPTDNSMLKKLWPVIQPHLSYSPASPSTLNLNPQQPWSLKRLALSWQPLPLPQPSLRPLHNKIQGFRLDEGKAQALGLVIHRILQDLGRYGLAWWEQKTAALQLQYIHLLLFQQELLPALNADAADKVKQAIQNTLQDTRGRWILEQPQAQSELALTALLKEQPQMLVIDRTFVDQDNIRWIIDYKTSMPQQQTLSVFLAQEKEKYAQQMLNYHQALRLIDPRPIRLGLYFPLVPAWQEWQND